MKAVRLVIFLFLTACHSPGTTGPMETDLAMTGMPDLVSSPDLTLPPDLACAAGANCTPANPCHKGVISCGTGTPVCTDTLMVVTGNSACTLLAYWPLDGSGADVAGGRDLTLAGGIGFADGVLGKGLDLHHNKSQFAQRNINDEIFNLQNTDFTIQAWIYFYDTKNEQTFFEKYTNTLPPTWSLTKLSSNQIRMHGPVILDSPVINFPLSTWLHVVLRRDATSFTLFYNGSMSVTAGVQAMQPSTVPLLVGKRIDADGRDFSFNGRIDELAIWQRALTNDEIKTLYNDGKGSRASDIN